jgi:hypothetical protein
MHSDLDVNIPNYAAAVVTTDQLVQWSHGSSSSDRFGCVGDALGQLAGHAPASQIRRQVNSQQGRLQATQFLADRPGRAAT